MTLIEAIHARQILDSRGNPTIECEVLLSDGSHGRAAVPSGASTGMHEAWELRDGDKKVFMGKGVLTAVDNVNEKIAEALEGMDATDQAGIDMAMIEMDGTPNKKNFGRQRDPGRFIGNRPRGRFLYRSTPVPLSRWPGARLLPAPMMNIINGGEHADNNVDVQEFMVMPLGFERFSDALRCGTEIFHHLKKVLSEKGYNTSVGDEGGFAPDLKSNQERSTSS